jgi:hypothetical protein
MPIQVRGVLVHAMSGTELSRVRTEFRLHLPEPINKDPLESRGPTLLCNQWDFAPRRVHRNVPTNRIQCACYAKFTDREMGYRKRTGDLMISASFATPCKHEG